MAVEPSAQTNPGTVEPRCTPPAYIRALPIRPPPIDRARAVPKRGVRRGETALASVLGEDSGTGMASGSAPMDRCRKRPDSDPEGSGEPEPPADKRPCTAEPSTSAAAPPPPVARPAEHGGSDMDTSSSGRAGDADADADGDEDDEDGDGDGDGDGGSSCESDGGGSSRPPRGGGGRFHQMVEAVAAEGAGQDALVTVLTELCEALSFCAEDAGGYFPTEAAARALVRLAGGGDGAGASPDVMLLSVRAITYLCDAMPRSSEAVVRHGLLHVLCSRLLAIEYLDVAEQCLQAFEKISRRQPTQCLQAGMITAVLAYIDFFSASIQRVAVSAVANACKKVPSDCSQSVMDSVPMLCNVLQSEDKMVVEKVAACLVSIVDSFCSSVDLLDQLCHQGVIEKVLTLINTGGLTALSQSTSSNLIGLLAKLACTSLVAVKSLFELNVGCTIKGILATSDLSHGMSYLPLEKQNNQVNEALKLVNQLIPSAPRDVEDTQMVLAKERIIVDEPRFLCQFSRDILPVLIKTVNSGANSYICYGCSSIVNNICYFSKPEMLQELLKETNISSFLAGLLSRKDHHVLISSLKIIEILMQKLPDAYLGSFIKEGVVYAVEALLTQEECSKSTYLPDDTQQSENQPQPIVRNKSTCFCYAFDSRRSEGAETRTCRIGKGSLVTFARHVKTTYFTTEVVSSEMGLTDILQKLKTCCAVLNESTDKSSDQDNIQNEEHLTTILSEVMMELHGGETMTTFEFLESGLVKSLSNYLSNGKYLQMEENMKDCSTNHFLSVLKRFQSFARMSFSRMDQGWDDMLLTLLVRKLQNALTSLDNFPVIMSHNFKPRSSISDIPTRHSTIIPCIRVRFKKDEDETKLSSYDSVLNVEISSSLYTIEEFLWPKVSTDTNNQKAESSPSSTALESKYVEDDSQERDSTPESSPPSEGLICENQSVESCSKQGTPSSGQAQRDTLMLVDHAVQPKLIFRLKGKELDRSVTLYQSILQDQINAGSDIILDTQFWRSVHDITFRTAVNSEANDSPKHSSTAETLTNDSTTGFVWQTLPFFSSLLLGKLPCKLDSSSPSYDILFMLKVLEGLNRYSFHIVSDEKSRSFAHGRITNLDALKAVVSSIPQQEFVSAKLTDKLEQQMRDPLVLRSRCLPLWCTELMSACSFLFSFEARWKYFQRTAFGSLTIQHGHMIDPSVSSITERGPSPSRKKFKVDRDDILVSAAKMMKSHARRNALLEVEYKEEVGTGLGPTMEFYTLISHEFQKSGLGMWRGELPSEAGTDDAYGSRFVVAPNGLFPRPWSASADQASFSEVTKRFHLLGQVVAKAIKDNRILDIPFSKAFYKLILGQELNMYDIQSFDPELAIPLMEFQALPCRRNYVESNLRRDCQIISDLSYRGCRIEDLAVDFALPGYPEYVLSSGSSSESLSVENLEEYVHLVVEATVKSGIARQLEAFKSGFNEVFPLNKLHVFSEDELERLFCGEQDTWDFEKLVDHIKFDHGYTSSSPPVINLFEVIQEFGCHQRRAFLQFITGSPRLPPGGLAALNPKFTVVRKHSGNEADHDLPSVMTCANYLKLPPYSSKERMREKLLYAITEGQGSFHLS